MFAEGAMREVDLISFYSVRPCPHSQYADDTTFHATEKERITALLPTCKCEKVFAEDKLKLNLQKTHTFTASKADPEWKLVRLLGSLLGSAEGVDSRINASNRAFGSVAWDYHSIESRLCMFKV